MPVKRVAFISGNATGTIPQPTNNTVLKRVSNSYQWVDDAEAYNEALSINTNGQTSFTLARSPIDGYVNLFLNQLKVEYSDYSISGTTITYSGNYAIQTSDKLEASYLSQPPSAPGNIENYYILSSMQSTTSASFQRVGAIIINKANIKSTAGITFRAVLDTTNGSAASEVQLYNKNTSSYISNSLLSSTTVGANIQSASLVYSDLSAGQNVYEIYLKRNGGSGADTVYCLNAILEING
jgi:hypothetical protein